MQNKRWWMIAALAGAALFLAAACGDDDGGDSGDISTPTPGESPAAEIQLIVTGLEDGGAFDVEQTCDGADLAPQVLWTGVPQGTQSLALVMEDLDRDFYHWVVVSMPPDTNGIGPGVPTALPSTSPEPTAGAAVQGLNDFGLDRYSGPCPPPGEEHTYRIRLYALDEASGLGATATGEQLLEAISDRVKAFGELSATYARR